MSSRQPNTVTGSRPESGACPPHQGSRLSETEKGAVYVFINVPTNITVTDAHALHKLLCCLQRVPFTTLPYQIKMSSAVYSKPTSRARNPGKSAWPSSVYSVSFAMMSSQTRRITMTNLTPFSPNHTDDNNMAHKDCRFAKLIPDILLGLSIGDASR